MTTSVEQAQQLITAISKASLVFQENWPRWDLTESEVKFRFEAIDMLLKLSLNDARKMKEVWEKDSEE